MALTKFRVGRIWCVVHMAVTIRVAMGSAPKAVTTISDPSHVVNERTNH